MSDFVGNPFSFDSNSDLRTLFINEMNKFADTLESASGMLVASFLAPYLSAFGAGSLLTRLSDQAMVYVLRDAANTVQHSPDCEGVIFGYGDDNGVVTIVWFDFTSGQIGYRATDLKVPTTDTIGEKLFFETSLANEINLSVTEGNVVPLVNSTMVLCGIADPEIDNEDIN